MRLCLSFPAPQRDSVCCVSQHACIPVCRCLSMPVSQCVGVSACPYLSVSVSQHARISVCLCLSMPVSQCVCVSACPYLSVSHCLCISVCLCLTVPLLPLQCCHICVGCDRDTSLEDHALNDLEDAAGLRGESCRLCWCTLSTYSPPGGLGLGICPSTSHSHTPTHSLSLVLVAMI